MSHDYPAIAQAALRACPNLLFAWLPGGRLHGAEYDVLNPLRDDRTTGNFRINTLTGKWSDFAEGGSASGGDLISLWAYLQRSSQSDAAADIERQLGLNGYHGLGVDPAIAPFLATLRANKTADVGQCLTPVPDQAPPAPLPFGKMAWCYHNAQGEVLGYVVRFEEPGQRKEFRPLTYWESGWQWKTWPSPKPLYGQARLAERLEAPVLVVEGEKTCEAGQAWFPDFVVITWPGGSSNAKHADWSRLAGRRVWLLPDADEPGKKAMAVVAETLRSHVIELSLATMPADLDAGWDVADFTGTVDEAQAWLNTLDWRVLKGPQPASDLDQGSRFDAELKRANGQGPQYAPVDAQKWTPKPIPVPVLARLEQEILRRVPVRHPIAAQQTALAIAARIAGRHTVTTAGDPTHLYLALAAPSVGDVRPYLHQAELIMEQVGLQQSVRKSRLSVMGQIQKTLWRQPATLYLCSEWGILLQFAKRQPAGSLEMALGLLAELWDGTPLTIDADDIKLPDADGGQQIVRAPCLSMLALLSHDQLATAVKLSEMGRGALEQIQYWILDDDDFVVVDPDDITTAPYPDDLIAELQRLSVSPLPTTGNLSGVTPWVLPPQVQARFAVAIQPFYAELDALQPHRSARSLLTTTRLIVRRILNDLAYFNDSTAPLITIPLMTWAMDEELARLRALFERFPALSGEEWKISAYDKVLEFITSEKSKGAGTRALQQYCRPYRNLPDDKRDALIKQMLADESVVEIQPESKPGARRKVLVYVARQFVKEVEK